MLLFVCKWSGCCVVDIYMKPFGGGTALRNGVDGTGMKISLANIRYIFVYRRMLCTKTGTGTLP